MAIDFVLSDSQRELQKTAREFAEGVLGPIADKIDRSSDGWVSFLLEPVWKLARVGQPDVFSSLKGR